MSELLHFLEHTLHRVALGFMALVYITRIVWILRFKAGKERQGPTEKGSATPTKSILYSWANIAMPWAMESTRKHPFFWVQFVVFHLGVTAAIGLLFIIPDAPWLLESASLVLVLQAMIGAAFLVGLGRIVRRIADPYMRAISSPDDYFSLILLTTWFFFAFLSAPNDTSAGEWHLVAYFSIATFFLIYVPFSKISHYLYYPFTRYYLGKTLGYRGVTPMQRGSASG